MARLRCANAGKAAAQKKRLRRKSDCAGKAITQEKQLRRKSDYASSSLSMLTSFTHTQKISAAIFNSSRDGKDGAIRMLLS